MQEIAIMDVVARWGSGDELLKACWVCCKAVRNPAEVVKGGMDSVVRVTPWFVDVVVACWRAPKRPRAPSRVRDMDRNLPRS